MRLEVRLVERCSDLVWHSRSLVPQDHCGHSASLYTVVSRSRVDHGLTARLLRCGVNSLHHHTPPIRRTYCKGLIAYELAIAGMPQQTMLGLLSCLLAV